MKNPKPETIFDLDPKIAELIEQAPSIVGNTAIVLTVRIITSIIGYVMFLGGIGMIIDSQVRSNFFDEWMHGLYNIPLEQSEFTADLILFAGIALVAVGLLFLFISRLTRMILIRNAHNSALWTRKEALLKLKEAEDKIKVEKEVIMSKTQAKKDTNGGDDHKNSEQKPYPEK
jgi:hypothetical protein